MRQNAIIVVMLCAMVGTVAIYGDIYAQPAKPTTQPATKKTDVKKEVTAPPDSKALKSGDTKKVETKAATKTTEKQAWWQHMLVTLLSVVTKVIIPVLGVLLMILVRKWGLKIDQEMVGRVVKGAVGAGEQAAKKALKDGKPLHAEGIKKVALLQGRAALEASGLPSKLGNYLGDLIEGELGERVIDAGGAAKVVNGVKPA